MWRYIVRPIAVGGMLVGAAYTLIRMGSKLTSSLGRALSEVRHGAPPMESVASYYHETNMGMISRLRRLSGTRSLAGL